MCILCGEFVMNIHWTDSSHLENHQSSDIIAGEFQRERKRSRIHQAKLANQISQQYGLSLKEWQSSKFILTNNKGKSEIIHDNGQLWSAAESILGYAIDPLSPDCMNKLTKDNSL